MEETQEEKIDLSSCEKLFSDHEKRAATLVNRYCRDINPNVRHLKDDIMSEALMALWKSCLRHRETPNNTFWTFAYLRVQGSITDYLRREKLMVRGDRLDSQVAFLSLDTTYKSNAAGINNGVHKEMSWKDNPCFIDEKSTNSIHTIELQLTLDKSPALTSTYEVAAACL